MIDQTILANTDAVKQLDKDIKGLLKEKNKKDNTKNKIVEEIKRLGKEILQMKKVDKADKASKAVVDVYEHKKVDRCRYYNRGHCQYKQKCRFLPSKKCV